MESFKELIAWALSPFIIGVGLQLIGFACWKKCGKRIAGSFLVIGTMVLVVGGLPVLTYEANRQRSLAYDPFQMDHITDAERPALIVVLGGGFDPDPWLSPTSRLGSTVMARFIEGVRLYRLLPDARLVVSFAGDAGTPEEKKATLEELGEIFQLDPDGLEILTEAESTADEARMTADMRRPDEQVIIATSAGHMPRAMLAFTDEDLAPIAAPTDFHFPREESTADEPWKRWIPSTGGHALSERWLYESVASLAQRSGLF
ncbi:MAG: ElyC/SanA/YdcF family protein [Verrucomicrobiota bacterium]